MYDITFAASRVVRISRRILWSRTALARARTAGVVLGPENFCYAPRSSWGAVIDVGVGHTPTFAPWIQRETGAFVILCDPTPKHMPRLRSWVKEHPRTSLLERAVTPVTGPITFFESTAQESGSIDTTHTNRGGAGRTIEVQGISLDDLLDQTRSHGEVSLVKLDTEGAEFRILGEPSPALRRTLLRCPQWLVEFHPIPQTRTHFLAVLRIQQFFAESGFRRFSPNGTDCLFYR